MTWGYCKVCILTIPDQVFGYMEWPDLIWDILCCYEVAEYNIVNSSMRVKLEKVLPGSM